MTKKLVLKLASKSAEDSKPRVFVAYYRVSTQRQGESGLGLDDQREAVANYIKNRGSLLREFVEVESGKGHDALKDRPQLREALEVCKKNDAVLVIARLDRLSRNVHFITGLMEAKVRFVACDLPDANDLNVHIMAAFAQHEWKRISERTRAALAQAKLRGVKLGKTWRRNLKPHLKDISKERSQAADAFASKLKGQMEGFRLRGLSQRAMVEELNQLGIATPRGKVWHLRQVQRTLRRLI